MVTKKGAGKSKSKVVSGGSKTAGGSSKTAGGGSKAASGSSKTAGAESVTGVAKASEFASVALKAPTRTGRTLKNVGNALDEFEFRLRVAEKYFPVLKRALPKSELFLAVGWSAVKVLREAPAEEGDGAAARTARAAMVSVASVVREIVVRTSRPGDAAREAVLVGDVLNPKLFASVGQCERILAGAKEWQGTFSALTDELLKELAEAVDAASKASGSRKDERASKAVERLSESDQKQLAVDVLLDCADHLGSAALSTMRSTHPNVVERLCRALEPDSADAAPAEPPPSPA